MLFSSILRCMIQHGTLRLMMAGGSVHCVGSGAPEVTVRLHRYKPGWAFALRPDLKLARAYHDGWLTIERGNLNDFLYILYVNYNDVKHQALFRLIDSLHGARENMTGMRNMSKRVYGFLPAPERTFFTPPAQKQAGTTKLLFTRPWRKLFHMRRGWGGLRLPFTRKRSPALVVALSLEQYRVARQQLLGKKLDQATQFKLQNQPPAQPKNTTRLYSTLRLQQANPLPGRTAQKIPLYDEVFSGKQLFSLLPYKIPPSRRMPVSGKARLSPRPATAPWTADHLFTWGRAARTGSDNFVRVEAS